MFRRNNPLKEEINFFSNLFHSLELVMRASNNYLMGTQIDIERKDIATTHMLFNSDMIEIKQFPLNEVQFSIVGRIVLAPKTSKHVGTLVLFARNGGRYDVLLHVAKENTMTSEFEIDTHATMIGKSPETVAAYISNIIFTHFA